MIIEKVSRSGLVLDHFQFDGNDISIGRAYDNDLILHDVYVDAAHLKLSYDAVQEGFWFEDLGTANGTQVIRAKDNKYKKTPANFICSGDTLSVGKTYLKVRSRVQDVPAAIKISVWDKVLSVVGNIWCLSFLSIALVAMETVSQYLSDPRSDKLGSKFLESIDLLFLVIAYGVIWAFIARVQKAEPRLLVHASLIAWCLFIISLFDLSQAVIYFNTGASDYAAIVDFIIGSVCIFTIVWFSLYLATELKLVLRFLLACLVPFGLALSLIVTAIQKPEFSRMPAYDSIVVSPAWQWRSGVDRAIFVKETESLYVVPEEDDDD